MEGAVEERVWEVDNTPDTPPEATEEGGEDEGEGEHDPSSPRGNTSGSVLVA
jgi:hypothetical protein